MTPTHINLEDQLAAALDVIIDQLGGVDERWPTLIAEHDTRGRDRVSPAEAVALLGPEFADHALFRAYEALSQALAALREHKVSCHRGIQEEDIHQPGRDEPAVAETTVLPASAQAGPVAVPVAEHGKRPLATGDDGPGALGEPMREATDAGEEEASVSIVGSGRASDRRGKPAAPEYPAGERPVRASLRDRLSSVLNGNSESATLETQSGQAERHADVRSATQHGRGEARTSRPPAVAGPPRRGRGLWREEASVVIVRSAAQSQPDEPAPSGSAGER